MAITEYVGSAIASAAALPLGASVGNLFNVTGTTAVTSMTVASGLASAGRVVKLVFASAGVVIPEVATGIRLHRPFQSIPNSVLVLACFDGITWTEIGRANDGPYTKALGTAEALISLADIALGSNDYMSGIIEYSIRMTDATDFQCRAGHAPFAAVSKSTTITAAGNSVGTAVESLAASSSTLTSALTFVAGTGKITIKAQPDSGLTPGGSPIIAFRIRMIDRGGAPLTNGVITLL